MPDTTTTDPAAAATTTSDPAPTTAAPPQGDPDEVQPPRHVPVAELVEERKKRQGLETLNSKLQKQLDAINQANESAIEKAQREATEAAAKATEYERQLLVQRVALDKGVPAAHIHRLSGTTEAELAADADELMAALNTPGSPKPDPSQGAKGGPAATGGPAQDFANIIQNMGQ